jgi:hypothetical protein
MRKITRLKNLRVKEISSVDRGAGEGVQVVLRKRDAELDDGDLAQLMLNASQALQVSIASLYADDSFDVQARDLALKETFEQYRQHVGQLIADAVDEEDAEEITAAKSFNEIVAEAADELSDDDSVVELAAGRRRRKRPLNSVAEPDPDKDLSEPNGRPINSMKGQTMVDMVKLAKSGEPTSYSKRDWYAEIESRAAQLKLTEPALTEASAFTKVICTSDGACLYRAYRRAQGSDVAATAPRGDSEGRTGLSIFASLRQVVRTRRGFAQGRPEAHQGCGLHEGLHRSAIRGVSQR